MTPRQVIFESCTSLLTCSTLKYTALIFYSCEPSTVQHCQLMIHSPENKIMCPTRSQILQESQHSINFFSKKIYIFFTEPSVLYLLWQFRPQNQSTWFVQAATTCPSRVCPLPICHRIFSLHIPWCLALQSTKLLCDTRKAAHPQPLTFCTRSLASS